MAKKNTTEAEVVVTLNGQAARNELQRIEAEIDKYEKAAADAYKASDKALGDKMAKKAKELRKEFSVTTKEMKDFSNMMKSLNSKSLNELKQAASQLKKQISQLAPGTQQFIEKSKQLQQVNSRIKSLEMSFKGVVAEEKRATLSLQGLADGFNKYFGMVTAGMAAITGLSMAFRKCAEDAAVLDDVYSDVMKTTGLLHEEVHELDQELLLIDTRTSREQLLLLARDAGKLGIQGKENILGFVRAADQIQVALGEDLGDGAIRNLGKIADVLGYTQSMGIEKSLLSIASSINAVGQASTASEAYLVDFTQRLAGVAAQTNISAADIIGFASGLDQSAMKVEMAATAFQKFLMKIYEDPAKFAEYANMEVEKFTDLLNNDANQAIITILKSLKDQDGFASLVPIFKDMGLDGARAVSVLAAMATNINAVTEAQALANQEFEKATSVTEEYNTKNNNLNAQLEKARKEFKNASIALGQSLNPILLKSTKATTYLIKALATYGKEIKAAAISVALFTGVVKAGAIAQGLMNAATKIGITLKATFKTVVLALKVAYFALTGQLKAAAAAQKALTAAMSTNVFGLLATAIATLTVAFTNLIKKQREAAEAADWIGNAEAKANDEYAEQVGTIRTLTTIVESNNIALNERKKALEELKKIVPGYHADLTEEGELINANTEAINEYCKSLRKQIRLDAYKEELTKLENKIVKKENEKAKAEEEKQAALKEANGDATEYKQSLGGPKFTKYGRKAGRVRVIESELDKLHQEEQQLADKIAELNPSPIDEALEKVEESLNEASYSISDGGEGGKGNKSGKADSKYQQARKDLEDKQREEENVLKQSFLNREISQEEYDKKMRELNLKHLQERVELAKEFGEDETSAMSAWLNAQIQANDLANQEIEALLQQRNDWEKAQQEELEAYMKKIEELTAEAQKIKDSLNPKEARQREMQTELEKLDELHAAKLLSEEEYEKAVKQLQKRYSDEEMDERLRAVKKYAEMANRVFEGASNFVTALKEAETQKLEAEYQAQLTAAGDNAEQRQQIEADYEKKKLDLQKKYADVDMAINIAKAIAAGALAAVEAFAAAGGNPVLGAVFAALIAITTAAEVASIIAQRNAIKNMSVNSSGSSSVKTGSRTMTGYAEGGFTEDHTTVTTVGERGKEWVAPHWMVQKNPTTFRNLERYRKSGSHGRSGSIGRGFADGGFTEPASQTLENASFSISDIEAAVETAIIRSMAVGAIRAYLVRKDLTELDNQTERFKDQLTR